MVDEKEMDLIDKAHLAAERIENANRKYEELIKKQEEIENRTEARRILGGQSTAGETKPVISEEEKNREGMKTFFKGGALERAFK